MAKHKSGDEVTFKIDVDLGDLIDLGGIDGMNDLADEHNPFKGFMLTDIGYNVIDHESNTLTGPSCIGGNIKIEVTAILEEL